MRLGRGNQRAFCDLLRPNSSLNTQNVEISPERAPFPLGLPICKIGLELHLSAGHHTPLCRMTKAGGGLRPWWVVSAQADGGHSFREWLGERFMGQTWYQEDSSTVGPNYPLI